MKPVHEAEPDGHELEPPGHPDVLAAVRGVDVHDDLHDEEHADHHQGGADGAVQDVVDEVAVVGLDVGDRGDAGQRRRDAAERQPERQGDVHGALAPVLPRAGDLGDGGVGDVGADRHGRLEAEEEDQDRRHERAAAHAGEADEEADQQSGDAEIAVEMLTDGEVDDEDEDAPTGQTDAPPPQPGPGGEPGGLGAGAERRQRVVDVGIEDVVVGGRWARHGHGATLLSLLVMRSSSRSRGGAGDDLAARRVAASMGAVELICQRSAG